ncbi:MAG: glutamate--cysteine ligase [Ilumatobacteraceae bacterium]
MVADTADFTLGVEEEFFVVDASSWAVVPRASAVIDASDGAFEAEFHQALVENASTVFEDARQLGDQLGERRAHLAGLASAHGLRLVSAGSVPTLDIGRQMVTAGPRFERMLDDYQQVAREQLICGSQTHVGFRDRDESIEVMNRIRPWLPVLLALSASSPFFAGGDTGYASYRAQLWSRWPTAGMPAAFGSWPEYQEVTTELVTSGAIADKAMLYWWLRPSQHAPTLEFRIADAATTTAEAVMLAGLSRGLARWTTSLVRDGAPAIDVRPEWLALSTWRASRFGLTGELLDPLSRRSIAGPDLVRRLVALVGQDIGTERERDAVLGTVERVLEVGNSADRQRRVFALHDRLEDVTRYLADETVSGSP